jgi:hypothetical protein
MRHLVLLMWSLFAVLAFSGTTRAQVTASITPNNISKGSTTKITMEGLPPGATASVIFAGSGSNGDHSNDKHDVVADANGKASWVETVSWGAGEYATNVSWRIGTGQPDNANPGTLNVTP